MSVPAPAPSSSSTITRVDHFPQWFTIVGRASRPSAADGLVTVHVRLHALLPNRASPQGYEFAVRTPSAISYHTAVVSHLSDLRIGQIGCLWAKEATPIEYKHARVRLGDLFEFYTSPEGVLRLPDWCSMRFAVDQFLEEDPRIKFHPLRVQQFIHENGVDQLELME